MEAHHSPDRRQEDILLEKVIKVTEDNLKAQNAYLQELTNIKNRFDMNDRDHSEVKTQLAHVTTNTFDIINKMNKVSNLEILQLLEKNEDCNTNFLYKFNSAEQLLQKLDNKFNLLSDMNIDQKDIKKTVIETKDSFSLIQKLLMAILILITGVQIASIAWKSVNDQALNKDVKQIIQQEIKKIK